MSIATYVDQLEAGQQTYPILFSGGNCDLTQYPSADGNWPNVGPAAVNLRTLACQQSAGVPAALDENSNISLLPLDTCPLPAIRSMIIPDNFTMTFYTPSGVVGRVFDPGAVIVTTKDTSNNILVIDTSSTSSLKWGSSSTNPPGGACKTDTASDFFWGSNGTMRQSIYSCGAGFFPSLSSVTLTNADPSNPYGKSGTNWIKGLASEYGPYNAPSDAQFIGYCSTLYGQTAGSRAAGDLNDDNASGTSWYYMCSGAGNHSSVTYSTGECLMSQSVASNLPFTYNQYFGVNPNDSPANNNAIFAICSQFRDCDGDGGGGCRDNDNTLDSRKCSCQKAYATNGNVENLSFTSDFSWSGWQFQYCSGQQNLQIGGINIERYGHGTPACDEIMPSMCSDTAFLSANPSLVPSCACITEQNRLQALFSSVDVPISCFSSACSQEGNPYVYQTATQTAGCSARLCSQFISVNGTALSANGFQTLTCNGDVYDVATIQVSVTGVPQLSIVATAPTPSLDSTFYVALGILILMVILLAMYSIRVFVLRRRANSERRQLEAETLTSALLRSPANRP